MKNTTLRLTSVLATLALASSSIPGPAAEIRKADNDDPLEQGSSWIGGVAPGGTDVAVWDGAGGGTAATAMANIAWGGLAIRDVANGPTLLMFEIAGTSMNPINTLTLGASGIDMSEANSDLSVWGAPGASVNLPSAQTWKVAGGRTLSLGCTNSGPGSLTKAGSGTLQLNYDWPSDDSHLGDFATLTLAGGVIQLYGGTHTETVGAAVVSPGATRLQRPTGSASLVLNGITRNVGGTVDFAPLPFVSTSTANDFSSGGGILGGWATVGPDWAQVLAGGGNQDIVPYPSFAYSQDFLPTENVSINNSVTLTNTTGLAINSLRLDFSGSPDLSLTVGTSGTYSLTNLSGGILALAPSASIVSSSTTRTLRGPVGRDLIFHVFGALTNQIVIADNGGCGLTKAQGGTLILKPPGNNTYTGPTRINAGTLMTGDVAGRRYLSSNLFIDTGSDLFPAKFRHGPADNHLNGVNITVNGGTLDLRGRIDACNTLALSNHATLTGYAPGGWLTVTNVASNAAVVAGSATVDAFLNVWGGLTKTNRGTLDFRRDSRVYGPTVIAQGDLQVEGSGTNGSPTNSTLILTTLTLGTGTNRARLVLGGTNSFGSGNVAVTGLVANAGSTIVGGAAGPDFNQLILNFDYDTNFDVGLLGGGSFPDSYLGLTKDGPGTLTLMGTRTYFGPTTNRIGRLKVGNPGAITNANYSFANFEIESGTLDLNGNSVGMVLNAKGNVYGGGNLGSNVSLTLRGGTIDGNINAGGAVLSVVIPTGADVTFRGTNSYSGGTLIQGRLNIDENAFPGGYGNFGGLGFQNGTLNILTNRNAPIYDRIILGGDAVIAGATVGNVGPAPFDDTIAEFVNELSGSSGTLTVTNVGANPFNGGFQVIFSGGDFTFTRPIVVASQPGGTNYGPTILSSFNTNGTTQTYAGPISGNSGFYRVAPFLNTGWCPGCTNLPGPRFAGGTTILAGTNTYTGYTSVTDGKLLINGVITSTNTAYAVGLGTLGGTGVILSPVIIDYGGTLSPGTSIGRLTISNSLTFSPSSPSGQWPSTCFMELSKNGSALTNDSIVGLTTVAYGGTLSLTNLGPTPLAAGDTFKLFSAINYSGAFTNITPATPGAGLVWDPSSLATSGTLRVAAAPAAPQFATSSLSGTNLALRGSGGTANGTYYILTSTNSGLVLGNWVRVATNTFDANGNFNYTAAVSPATPQRFFVLQLP